MKLKKLVSLALAGVLAVSMLAGCKANGSSSSEQPATGVNATTVIAALDKKVTEKVEFKASTSLQATVDKAMTYAQDTVVGQQFSTDLLKKVDDKLNVATKLPAVVVAGDASNSGTTDKAAQNYTFVVKTDDTLYGATDAVVTKKLADLIAGAQVDRNNGKLNEQAVEGGKLTDNGDSYKYTFKYTADVAVTSATNANGQVTYYAVVTLTRTPSRVAVKA